MKWKLVEHNTIGQTNFGNNDDTRKHLTIGKVYNCIEEIHSWHTKLIIGGHKFNSVCFEKQEV